MDDTADHPLTSETILNLIRAGSATTRADLARLTKLAPSTVSIKVQELLDTGLVAEDGAAQSTGGRRGRRLRATSDGARYLVADLGTSHARLALIDANGEIINQRSHTLSLEEPSAYIPRLAELLRSVIPEGDFQSLTAMCIGLPAPVNVDKGYVDSGSRMPGWTRFPFADSLGEVTNTPVTIENDANLMAMGEHYQHPNLRDSFTVKAGGAVGVGVIINGRIHRGATGAAGDVSHVRNMSRDLECACGNVGCLDTVMGGVALLHRWNSARGSNDRLEDLAQAANDTDPIARRLLRDAGEYLGASLCSAASFMNPEAIFLGGILSTVDTFVAAIRSTLYAGCHPLITRNLIIERASSGPNAALLGGARLLITGASDKTPTDS